jgi:hypothetical protein
MMKTACIAAFAALVTTAALAQQTESPSNAPAPDYSRPTLIRVLSADDSRPQRQSSIQFDVGSVTFNALGTTWRFDYMPFRAPLPGSFSRGRGIGSDIANAFELTHTELPYTPRTWRDNRALSKELQRIEKSERAKVKVNPE